MVSPLGLLFLDAYEFASDTILFLEIVDDVPLLLVNPSGERHDDELQGLRKRRHTGPAYQRLTAVMKVAVRLSSTVESAGRTAPIE